MPAQQSRSEIVQEYGHPWPWQIREIVKEHAVETNVDLRDLADRWGCSYKQLHEWIRHHGYRTENYRAKR